jgi:quinol monooxygenase YgiN
MKTNNNISWTVDGKIIDKAKYYEAQVKITTATYAEKGSLNHEWYVAKDGETIHIYERYENAETALKHLETWAKFADLFQEGVTMDTFNVYGDLTPELEQALSGATKLMNTEKMQISKYLK